MANGEDTRFHPARIVSFSHFKKYRQIKYLNPDGSAVAESPSQSASSKRSKAQHPAGKNKKPFDQYEGQSTPQTSGDDLGPEFPWTTVMDTKQDETMPHGMMRPEEPSPNEYPRPQKDPAPREYPQPKQPAHEPPPSKPREYPKPDWGKNAPKKPKK
jgi:hypothetical protein